MILYRSFMPLESSAGPMKPSRTLYPVIAQFISNTTHVSEQRNVINFLMQNVVVKLLISVLKFSKNGTNFGQNICLSLLSYPTNIKPWLSLDDSNALRIHWSLMTTDLNHYWKANNQKVTLLRNYMSPNSLVLKVST